MKELLFLRPAFKEVIWGGHTMRDLYGYDIPGDDTGEAWVVSAHPGGESTVSEGRFRGVKLSELYATHPELFGCPGSDSFPLLVKIIDARDDLSVQVHPDDAYAFRHENGACGKSECWYILDCAPDADIVIGHRARDRDEMEALVRQGKWEEFLRIVPIHPGDFFFLPAGTLHAIRRGTLVLETQQNCDLTYRVYDYGRLQDGKPRELNIGKALDVIRVPHRDAAAGGPPIRCSGYTKRQLLSSPLFTVEQYVIEDTARVAQDHPFLIVDVIEGRGEADGHPIKAGDHFIAPAGYGKIMFEGKLSLITSHI